jgi:uncharacterized MAPEG superfamily protein
MTLELKLLVWSTALAIIQMLIALFAAIAQVGLSQLVGNREYLPAFEGWAGRAQRAHHNMLESLIIFAALVLVAQVAGKSNAVTALGAQLFFWARLAYAPVYVIGIPWLRTGLWGVSFVGLLQSSCNFFRRRKRLGQPAQGSEGRLSWITLASQTPSLPRFAMADRC